MEALHEKERCALILCDVQQDLLGSLKNQGSLLAALLPALEAARAAGWLIVFSGLQFQSGYAGVSPRHRLYGALSKLNGKLGDKSVHWFMKGYAGADMALVPRDKERVVWRQTHLPLGIADLAVKEGITKAVIVGAKASGAVQAVCQVLVDTGVRLTVVRECVGDDEERLGATLDHLLPIYADVITLREMLEDCAGGVGRFLEKASNESRQALVRLETGGGEDDSAMQCTDCGRRGHGRRFIQLLLERPGWKEFPTQTWYEDFIKGEFLCPLGKKIVDFCDEPEFSKTSMYIAGREWLDEKDKVIRFAGKYMPVTYCLEDGLWDGGERPPGDHEEGALDAPWFVKEADKNLGGEGIGICHKPSEIGALTTPGCRYVVQVIFDN